jgi:HYR domain
VAWFLRLLDTYALGVHGSAVDARTERWAEPAERQDHRGHRAPQRPWRPAASSHRPGRRRRRRPAAGRRAGAEPILPPSGGRVRLGEVWAAARWFAAGRDRNDAAPGNYAISASVSDSGPGSYNTNPAKFTLTVTAPAAPVDDTAPVIAAPADLTVEATAPKGAVVSYNATATDDVDGPVDVTGVPASGSTFPLGITTVNLSATDAAGNEATDSFQVTVRDTTPPALPDLRDVALDATSAFGAVANYGPATASDIVDGNVPVDFAIPSGSTFPLGTTTVNYSATDSHGNPASDSFVVKVTVPWNGLNQPINRDGSSSFKLGSTVPVKFNSFPGLNAKLSISKGDSTPDGTDLEAINSNPADTGNLFRYDTVAGQYIFNLGTKNLSVGDWYLHVNLGDGIDHITKISLRK